MQMCMCYDLNAGSDLLIQHMLKLKLDAVAQVAAMALSRMLGRETAGEEPKIDRVRSGGPPHVRTPSRPDR